MLFCYTIQALAKKLINNYYPLLNVITITKSYNIIPMQKSNVYHCTIAEYIKSQLSTSQEVKPGKGDAVQSTKID